VNTGKSPRLLATACLLIALGTAVGAFGAHGLEETLEKAGGKDLWDTASFYWMVNALGLLGLGAAGLPSRFSITGPACILVGMTIFAGTVYALALGSPRWLGAVTPIGGTLLIVGWALTSWAYCRLGKEVVRPAQGPSSG